MSQEIVTNPRRRLLIKLAVFGGLAFVAGKFFEPLKNMIEGDRIIDEKVFNNFKVTETGRQLKIADTNGDDIVIFDKDTF